MHIMLSRACLLSIIVEKSKKCVDFTFTLFFVHTMACTFYEVGDDEHACEAIYVLFSIMTCQYV